MLNLTEGYYTEIGNDNIEYVERNREYECRVLNRRTHVSFNLLIGSEAEEILEDEIMVAVEKKGTILVPYKKLSDEIGGRWATLIGALVVLIIGYITYLFYPDSKIPIIIVALAGALNLIIGLVTFYSIVGWRHWNDEDDD